MEAVLGHSSGILFLGGAAFTSFRLSRYGKERADREFLRVLYIVFASGVFLWAATPYSSYAAGIAATILCIAVFLVMLGGVPGLRLSLPVAVRDRVIMEQIVAWVGIIVVMIVWQKST